MNVMINSLQTSFGNSNTLLEDRQSKCWYNYKHFVGNFYPMEKDNKKNYIKDFREQKGYSLAHLGDLMNVSNQTVSNYELGKRSLDWDMMQRFSKALDCHPMELVVGPNDCGSEKEQNLLAAYRELTADQKALIDNMFKNMRGRQ